MKVIHQDFGFLVYQKIFHSHSVNTIPILVWQNQESGRKMSQTKIHSFNLETKQLHLDKIENLNIDKEKPLYFYSQRAQLIFKSDIIEMRDSNLSVKVPTEIKLLDAPDVEVISGQLGIKQDKWVVSRDGFNDTDLEKDYVVVKSMASRSSRDQEFLQQEFNPISLDEEDKLYADKREVPRAKPKAQKKVKVKFNDSSVTFKLYDLSQGGMAFITEFEGVFNPGQMIQVQGFDEYTLDDPIIGEVKSVRQIEGEVKEFKVGVKFNEGQS